MQWAKKQTGFTIVELLIVVIVIAILATITVVGFTGIQNRAYDSAVRSDFRNLAGKVHEYRVLNQEYPKGGSAAAAFTDFGPVSFSRPAYLAGVNNIYYCVGLVNGTEEFALVARGRTELRLMYSSMNGFGEHSGTWGGSGDPCNGAGIPTTATGFSYKYGVTSGNSWNAWVQ